MCTNQCDISKILVEGIGLFYGRRCGPLRCGARGEAAGSFAGAGACSPINEGQGGSRGVIGYPVC
ncbi:MAG: hypothetical protein ACLR7Z_15330 [Bilophila wadsworthia]